MNRTFFANISIILLQKAPCVCKNYITRRVILCFVRNVEPKLTTKLLFVFNVDVRQKITTPKPMISNLTPIHQG